MSADCVILAAGCSARMGCNKLLLTLGGRTVLERCIAAFYGDCARIIVVTGRYHREIVRHLPPDPKIYLVYNETYRQGMFDSVKEGLCRVTADRFFLTPGDYPLLQRATIRQMADTDGRLVVPVYKGVQGHPVLMDKQLIPAILGADAPSLRDCLKQFTAERREIDVADIGVLTDLDTEEAYRRLEAVFLAPERKGQTHGDREQFGEKPGNV